MLVSPSGLVFRTIWRIHFPVNIRKIANILELDNMVNLKLIFLIGNIVTNHVNNIVINMLYYLLENTERG